MSIKLSLRGSHVPSLKNGKMILWKQKRVMTKPETQEWMQKAINSLVQQLRSISRTSKEGMEMGVSLQSWIALSMPEDDCWTRLPKFSVECKLCSLGEEGAEIVIERIE